MDKNVMKKFFGFLANEHPPVEAEAKFIEKVFKQYGKNGYAIMSAFLPNNNTEKKRSINQSSH